MSASIINCFFHSLVQTDYSLFIQLQVSGAGTFLLPPPPALDDWEGPGESGYLGCGSEKERWWEGERREGSGPEPVEEDEVLPCSCIGTSFGWEHRDGEEGKEGP